MTPKAYELDMTLHNPLRGVVSRMSAEFVVALAPDGKWRDINGTVYRKAGTAWWCGDERVRTAKVRPVPVPQWAWWASDPLFTAAPKMLEMVEKLASGEAYSVAAQEEIIKQAKGRAT